MPEFITIERQSQLDDICQEYRRAGRFAFDTEFVMEDRFEAEVCLVQIASERSAVVIDPFLKLDLSPIWDLVCDKQVETIVHAGQEDLAICVQHAGQVPRKVFDVQVAAGLAGYEYPLSLQKLVQTTLHIRLHKSKTLTDWRKRPLSPAQVRYGAEDVCHLLAVKDNLDERLTRQHRLDWVKEEFRNLEDMSLYRRAEEEKLLRVRGSGSLRGRQVVILKELLAWREQVAQKLDRPVRALLKDHLLVAIAKHELTTVRDLRDLRGLNLSEKHARAACGIVRTAMETPPEQWPKAEPREAETPAEAALVALVTGVLRSYCVENEIAYGLLATKKSIREIVRSCSDGLSGSGRRKIELLKGWRGDAVGMMLEELLTGQRSARVERQKGTPVIRVLTRRDATRGKSSAPK